MEENIFQEEEQVTVETNAFSTNSKPEYAKPKPCPPGHYRSMQAGGNGHYPGDKCGCGDGNGTSVPINNIVLPLLLTAIVVIIIVKLRKAKH